ncbi:3-hydroxyacyl-CoA dehydrogenase family protein [Nafulsella turpanensis]|uniref:3-hydroxyacyl-CoA dehydrogenase family protein n=1 Tax=Nafulsella turpanensis TaxID=1265690 RepID=UPI000349826E|nr:3-hydroxyacyl-CoA dehydrogenase family protein [Nafulsella turpanensis]
MKILAVGNERILAKFREKFAGSSQDAPLDYHFFSETADIAEELTSAEVVFDFTLDEEPENIELYLEHDHLLVFCNMPKMSLAEVQYYNPEIACMLVRFNGLPTFLNRPLLEVSLLEESARERVEAVGKVLGTEIAVVADRVGMATPRVICMIINEAFYTVQEGTASREDIDLGMKLGTNYPYGPFEWCERIGVGQVYELLEAMYEDTKDERYKICPLLKHEYLKAQKFEA